MTRFWTTAEVALVRKHYPLGGVEACLPHLDRTRSSIYQRARSLGLNAPGFTGVRERWRSTPEIDARIRLLHQQPPRRRLVADFAARIRRPQWWVSRRARDLGLTTPRFTEPRWAQPEIDLLHETAHLCTDAARNAFRRAGYSRTGTAITMKRKLLGIHFGQAKQLAGIHNANQLADLLGVDRKTILRWILRRELRATRVGELWNVTESDLRDFILAHPLRIDLRKLPPSAHLWFIELIARKAA